MARRPSIIFVTVVILGLVHEAAADRSQPCTRVSPSRATSFYNRTFNNPGVKTVARTSCNAGAALAEDNRYAGLDHAPGAPMDLVDGRWVSGCVRFEFPLRPGWQLTNIEVTARPDRDVCSGLGAPCQPPQCGLGSSFLVFTSERAPTLTGYTWRFANTVRVTTPNWAQYSVALSRPSPYIMVCRSGAGPGRDDIAIDVVKGCAVRNTVVLPKSLTRSMISDGVFSIAPKVDACRVITTARGRVKISVRVNPDGTVGSAVAIEAPDLELGSCVARTLERALFAPTEEGGVFSYPFTF
jgi:hypothetical protein